MEYLIINKLNKSYGQNKVIKNINLSVNKGELISLLGESGSGKSTLLKIIAGIEKQDSGTMHIEGIDISDIPIQKRNVAMVFQDYALFPHLTAIENIEFGPKMRGVSKAARRKKAIELLTKVQLDNMQNRYPHQLSGGQKQRVAIARALATEPKVLLLDEPFSSLDANLKLDMCDFIKLLQQEIHITTILVTHDREEAMRVSDRLVIINQGEIIQIGKSEDLYNCPNSISSAKYLGDINTINDICFRPEAVELFAEYQEGSTEAIVEERIFTGEKMIYTLRMKENKIKSVVLGTQNKFETGQSVFIRISEKGIIRLKR